MAFKRVLTVVAIIAALLPAIAHATHHIVGDDHGWTLNFDYAAWAKDRVFHVGDTLVFKYPVGVHNVFKVDGAGFQACKVPSNGSFTSGNDRITLATPGRKWYICGKAEGGHCRAGQKLAITVLPATTEHIVGDASGWTRGFNYTAWAEGRVFQVGDTLVFNYPVGYHNVFKVDGLGFQYCSVPSEKEAMTSGHDRITLVTAGRKWYICGKRAGAHCRSGQRLFITVLP